MLWGRHVWQHTLKHAVPEYIVQSGIHPDGADGTGDFHRMFGLTVIYSFTGSRLLPKTRWVGFDQYDRLWDTTRWIVSIENLAIYGGCMLTLSLVLGFVMAALLDQRIRFENTFRTIFLYPYALSFVVTGLTWQWMLNPIFACRRWCVIGASRFRLCPADQW